MSKYEDKDICRACGGYCCKKSGCDYATSNFDNLGIKSLHEKLAEGNISIVSFLTFKRLPLGILVATPFLYLRARNVDRDVVDLLSFKKQCSMLKEDGCSYTLEERPKGGVNLIPKDPKPCVPDVNPFEIVNGWEQYQNTLSRLVKRITGKSVDAKLREDVTRLFEDILEEKFEGVSEVELEDVRGMLPSLLECFPKEYKNALKNVKDRKKVYMKI